jgi:hypothetical protein
MTPLVLIVALLVGVPALAVHRRGFRAGLAANRALATAAEREGEHTAAWWRADADRRVALAHADAARAAAPQQRRLRGVLAEARLWKSEARWAERRAARAEDALWRSEGEIRRLRALAASDEGTER